MPQVLGIVPVPRWHRDWYPPERPREGFYHCVCGHYHDDNGYQPKDYPQHDSEAPRTAPR